MSSYSKWHPDVAPLTELMKLIEQSSSPSSEVRSRAFHALEQAKRVSDVNNYLCYLLVYQEDTNLHIRSASGLLLKNNIRFEHIPQESLKYVENNILQGLRNKDYSIRSISGTVVTNIVSQYGILSWLDLLPSLCDMTEGHYVEEYVAESALEALCKICEDSADDLDRVFEGNRPALFLMPKLFHIAANHPNFKFQQHALFCLNQFAIMRCQTFYQNLEQYMSLLFHLASNSHDSVRRNVCIAIVTLIDVCPDKLAPGMDSLNEYILFSSQSSDHQLALEACEFWLAVAEEDTLRGYLKTHLDRIIPILLKGMIYTDDECFALGADEVVDASLEDKDHDIAPQHAKSRHKNKSHQTFEKEDDGSDDEDGNEDIYSEWTYRKCCAAAYDGLSNYFPEQILQISLPYLNKALFHEDWKTRESAVLALGAIAEGCYGGIKEHLPVLIPYLLTLLDDPKPLLRQITCWTLSRYSSWAANITKTNGSQPNEASLQQFFVPMMQGLLNKMLDKDKRVQEAACSSFVSFEEYSGNLLKPYLNQILPVLNKAFETYKRKNLLILYDTVQTLAEHVGPALKQPDLYPLILLPLLHKWQQLPNDDKNLFPLFECLSSVAIALGDEFSSYALPVYTRCMDIIASALQQAVQSAESPDIEEPDKDFIVTSLDMISGLIQGLGPKMQGVLLQSKANLTEVMIICMKDENEPDVRQSAFALLGDMAFGLFDLIKPYLNEILSLVLDEMVIGKETYYVCNNAIWALGEIAVKYSTEMHPWIDPAYTRLLPLLNDPKATYSIHENAAITIGRLGSACPDAMAGYLGQFSQPFLRYLQNIKDNEEKDSAFRGYCIMLSRNPLILPSIFPQFLRAISYIIMPSGQLKMMIREILNGYRPHCPNWDANLMELAPERKAQIESYLIG